jgi:hypothetical protein
MGIISDFFERLANDEEMTSHRSDVLNDPYQNIIEVEKPSEEDETSEETNVIEGDNMPEETTAIEPTTPIEDCGRCNRKKPNLCNDLVYTFGSKDGCREEGAALEGTGGTHVGYGINAGILREVKVVWEGHTEASEVIVVQRNGEDIAWVKIDGQSGVECCQVKEKFCDCDVINVVSRAAGASADEVGEWLPAGCITVTTEIEPQCRTHFMPEGDGIAEAYDATNSVDVTNGNTWYTRTLDTERLNTMPAYANFDNADDAYELKHGVYKIDFGAGIEFTQSINIAYTVKLQENVDGAGWVDIPAATNIDHNLSGDNGNVSATLGIAYYVPHGSTAKIRIQEMISQDTSIQAADAGGKIVVQRIANGIATMASLHS